MPNQSFDVFLCHNDKDKAAVIDIANALIQKGLKPWLDSWELRPGMPWQRELERQIAAIGAAAVFVGDSGIGPWQFVEQEMLLRKFVKLQSPVIPVILPQCTTTPDLPPFLEGNTWVDFRADASAPMDRLIWGITGNAPRREVLAETADDGETLAGQTDLDVATATGTRDIELTINQDFETFTEPEKHRLLEALDQLLGVGKVTIVRERPGSVKLTLRLEPAEAERLLWAVAQGSLEQFNVVGAEEVESVATMPLEPAPDREDRLVDQYERLKRRSRTAWTEQLQLQRLLGRGGQGEVYLATRRGADAFEIHVAVKLFSPDRYTGAKQYHEAMQRLAEIAARVATIQQDNLVQVENFVVIDQIHVMQMEWIDGYDLRQLLSLESLQKLRSHVSDARWRYINDAVVTDGPGQCRFRAGIAIEIARECLAALAAMHREGLLHGDIKPSNIMLHRRGQTKLIDIGSTVDFRNVPWVSVGTPVYAPPEILEGASPTPASDLASLGYTLIELVSGANPFASPQGMRDLLQTKRELSTRLHEILPKEILNTNELMQFFQGLVAVEPSERYESAEAALHAASDHIALLQSMSLRSVASAYHSDLRAWLEELKSLEPDPPSSE